MANPAPYVPKTTLLNGYFLLAHVPDLDEITTRETAGFEEAFIKETRANLTKEARFPYFAKGYVNIDTPRHAIETRIIQLAIDAAGGQAALADVNGVVQREYRNIDSARQAREGARMVLAGDLPDEAPAPEPPTPALSAPEGDRPGEIAGNSAA